ncbi:alanine racemase [Marinomonas epiphytica]
MARPLVATVDLTAILFNYRYAKKLQPNRKAFAVVKSNAYGHGAKEVALFLDDEVDAFAVAAIEEALALREAGVTSPIMLLEGVFEAQEWALCEQHGFWAAVENAQQMQWLMDASAKIEKVFVKLDTGMHRLGADAATAQHFVEQLRQADLVEEVLLMTHFACADDIADSATLEQLTEFERARHQIGGIAASVANSAAIMKWAIPEGGWIRPGIMLYGISPFAGLTGQQLGLKPAMNLTSKVISVRDIQKGAKVGYGYTYEASQSHQLATVAIGYGDGYPRHAHTGTPLTVDGQAATLVGRVAMDMIMVKAEDAGQTLSLGQTVEIWGEQVPVENVADHAGTIGYELVTRMTARPTYRYLTEENATTSNS